MVVRPGYKRTEVGLIPEEWDISTLQEACRAPITYGIVQCGPQVGSGIPYVRVSDMEKPELDVDGMLRTSPAIAARFPRSTLQHGDIVYALRGKLGEVRQVSSSVVGANLTQGTARLSPKEGLLSDYFVWGMRSPHVLRQAEIASKGTTFREITLADLRSVCLAIPPRPEQRDIAAALNDVDALLGGLDRLIAKKRGLKRAAMQQLLTGKTRLPGFQGEWKSKKFSDLLRYERPDKCLVKSSDYEECGDTPVLTANKSFFLGYTNENVGIYESLPVIIFDDFTTDSKYVEFPFKVKSSAIKILRSRKAGVNLWFVAERMRLVRFPVGEHKRYYISEYQHVELPTPDPEEQCDIAAALADMDAELAALQARRDKTHDLKQAMMQELLTGKTRLVPAVAAHA